jgi:hypothetical protein
MSTTDSAPAVDEAKVEEFVGKVVTDVSGLTTTVLASIGDRLELWKALATNGPTTSTELAERAGVNERYAWEWLGGMASAGYLEYDPATRGSRCHRSTPPPWRQKVARCSSAARTR